MKTISLTTTLSTAILSLFFVFACSQSQNNSNVSQQSASNQGQASVIDEDSERNILQIAKSSPDHTTLAAAIEAAEIQNVLVNAGPLTVFAPNNQAFENLPDGTVEELLEPENKQKLAKILTSHASPANISEKQLEDGLDVYLATGQYVKITEKNGEFFINDAKILASIDASNGYIHVIDDVFLIAAE